MEDIITYLIKRFREKKQKKREAKELIQRQIQAVLQKEIEESLALQKAKEKAKENSLRKEEQLRHTLNKPPLGRLFPMVEDVRAHIKHLDTRGTLEVHAQHNADHYRIAENVVKFGEVFKDKIKYAVETEQYRIDRVHFRSGKKFQELDLSKLIDEVEEYFYKSYNKHKHKLYDAKTEPNT